MALYDTLQDANWLSRLDNDMLREERDALAEQLIVTSAERDVLERIITKALTAGAEAALGSALEPVATKR